MRALETIKLDHFYHRGINGEDLFYSDKNYRYFLNYIKNIFFL